MNNFKEHFFIITSLFPLISADYSCCYASTDKYNSLHWHHYKGNIDTDLCGVILNQRNSIDSNTTPEFTYIQINKIDENDGDGTYAIRDPGTAFTMAFAPGFFIHGLGHSYIGEKKTFRFLLLTEIVSISMYGYGFYLLLPSAFGNPEGGNSAAGGALAFTGTFLFFWSWIYDFTMAPARARELNKLHGYSLYFYPDLRKDLTSLNFKIIF